MTTDTYRVDEINQHLNEEAKQYFNTTYHLAEVTSTNDYLLKKSQEDSHNAICITENQTRGRGRRGQKWISNSNDICFSLLWHSALQLDQLSGISLVTGISIIEALEHFSIPSALQLKWPNDIFCNKKKLGGILIESTQKNNVSAIIIGIGINIQADENKQNLPLKPCYLAEISEKEINPNILLAHIINKFTSSIAQFEKHGLEPFIDTWKQYDLTYGREVSVNVNSKITTGTSYGINKNGDLILKNNNNEEIIIHSGSISLSEKD